MPILEARMRRWARGELDRTLPNYDAAALLEEAANALAAARAVCEAQYRVICAVTPGHPGFLHAKGPEAAEHPGHAEMYSALFSEWHAATRRLAERLGEPKR
jgi:hypothetical protein